MTRVRRSRVRLVDDHELVGVALEQALATSTLVEYLGRSDTVEEVVAQRPSAEVVVLDLRLGNDSSPMDNVLVLTRAGVSVVVYTAAEDPYLIRVAAQAPISAVVRKSAPLADLVAAIERCASGELSVSTEWAAAMLTDQGLDEAGLSPREREVLVLLAAGMPSKAAARQLGIAIPTLEVHLSRLREKYARVGRPARLRSDLAVRAVEDGYLPLRHGRLSAHAEHS